MAEPEAKPSWWACPECGALNRPEATACFLCAHQLQPPGSLPPKAEPGPAPWTTSTRVVFQFGAPRGSREASGTTFHLSSLMLVIALIAVCLGVYFEAPGLGVPLAALSFLALARTVSASERGRYSGRPLSLGDKLAVFFATIGVAILVLACALIALVATCYAICSAGGPQFGPVPLAILVFVVAGATIWGASIIARRLSRVGSPPRGGPFDL